MGQFRDRQVKWVNFYVHQSVALSFRNGSTVKNRSVDTSLCETVSNFYIPLI